MAKLLIVDDEKAIRSTLGEILGYEGHEVHEAVDGQDGWEKISATNYDCVFCDIKMPRMDGIELLTKTMKEKPELPFIMISGHGTIETAVEAVKIGAFDFIQKPPDLNRLMITLRNALDKTDLVVETKRLKKKVASIDVPEMIGNSEPMQKIKDTIEKVAPTDARVLIIGPNGSGKELVARWIHAKSNRNTKVLVEVNCAAIPSELIESELFGHEKGSFTSAIKQRIGKFEQADQGTLFLDEIGDMHSSAQAKVLRALQEGKIVRVGGEKEIDVNIRIISATNKDLLKETENSNFRLDLYHRLGVIIINVPSLNERSDDIPLLAKYFIQEICMQYNIPIMEITDEALDAMKGYTWTGNIRELRNVVERLIIMSDKQITASDFKKFVIPIS